MKFKALLLWVSVWVPGVLSAGENLNLKQVAEGIYVHQGLHEMPDRHNQGEIANIGFIIGERCVAVIDSGGSPKQGMALKAAIQAITQHPICYVINSHAHPDHVYGNIAFKQPGVSFIGHKKLPQALAARGPFYLEKAHRDLGLDIQGFVSPDRVVEGVQTLDLGGRTLTLTAHGTAHTDNDLSVFDDKTQTLWLSDLLFMGHIPVIDGSLNGWIKEIEALKKIKAALVIPGHGPVSAQWPGAIDAELKYLTGLQAEIRAYLKQSKTMEQAMAEIGQSSRKDWQLFDEFHKRNIATAFSELEWE